MNPDDCMEAIHNILVHKFQAIRIVRVRVACCSVPSGARF